MPAAAVIPAPIAYIKVVAVKKLVVGSRVLACGTLIAVTTCLVLINRLAVDVLYWVFSVAGTFTLRKLECLKQALRLNNVAWNNRIGPRFYFVGFVEH